MAKIVDITEKLAFDENPVLVVRGKKLEVQADAENLLVMMGLFNNESNQEAAIKAYKLLFTEKDRKKLADMKLSFKDLMVVIQEAITLATGEEDNKPGETQTHTMTS